MDRLKFALHYATAYVVDTVDSCYLHLLMMIFRNYPRRVLIMQWTIWVISLGVSVRYGCVPIMCLLGCLCSISLIQYLLNYDVIKLNDYSIRNIVLLYLASIILPYLSVFVWWYVYLYVTHHAWWPHLDTETEKHTKTLYTRFGVYVEGHNATVPIMLYLFRRNYRMAQLREYLKYCFNVSVMNVVLDKQVVTIDTEEKTIKSPPTVPDIVLDDIDIFGIPI